MAKKESIEELVQSVRTGLESMEESCELVREGVTELQDRFHRKKVNVPWIEAEILESTRRELYEWIVKVQTGEVD